MSTVAERTGIPASTCGHDGASIEWREYGLTLCEPCDEIVRTAPSVSAGIADYYAARVANAEA